MKENANVKADMRLGEDTDQMMRNGVAWMR